MGLEMMGRNILTLARLQSVSLPCPPHTLELSVVAAHFSRSSRISLRSSRRIDTAICEE